MNNDKKKYNQQGQQQQQHRGVSNKDMKPTLAAAVATVITGIVARKIRFRESE